MTGPPIVAIPLGDPAGIGPEIVVKALQEPEVWSCCRPLVIGDLRVVQRAAHICGLVSQVRVVSASSEVATAGGRIDVLDLANVDPAALRTGEVQAMCGRAAFDYVQRAVGLALAGEVDAVATPPLNKEALRAAGIAYVGHTEILAALTGVRDPLAMFEVRRLRVFFLSRHVSLRQACELVTKQRLLDYVARCTEALERLGVAGGTLAVAGLNPHSGEHGMFGSEESEHIVPAVREARERGYDVEGPVAADSVFHLALLGRYAAVLSLYHDQGHVAAKTVDFERAVAITNGLPFLRTSVDHGTAFDIAGTGRASAVSMVQAILAAARYAPLFARPDAAGPAEGSTATRPATAREASIS